MPVRPAPDDLAPQPGPDVRRRAGRVLVVATASTLLLLALNGIAEAATIGHGGGINCYKTFALRVPSERLYVAVLHNADSGLVMPEMVANKVAAIAIGKPYPEFSEIKLAPASLGAFAGVYKVDDKVSRTMRLEDGKLVMERTGRSSVALAPFSDNGFFIPDSLEYMEFGRDATGAVTHVTYHQGDAVSVHACARRPPSAR